jgi:hypothetical protein
VLSESSSSGSTDDVRPGLRISTNLSDTPKLYVNDVLTAATYDAGTGTLTPNSALSEGVQVLKYSLTDAAGNESAKSAGLRITVDTTAPSTPSTAPDLSASADAGASSSDNITSNNRPDLQVGRPLPVGVTQVDLLVNGQVVAATYDSQTGLLQPNAALPDGSHSVSYHYIDAAGNQGPTSPALSLTIDTAVPVQPSAAADVLSSSDSGTIFPLAAFRGKANTASRPTCISRGSCCAVVAAGGAGSVQRDAGVGFAARPSSDSGSGPSRFASHAPGCLGAWRWRRAGRAGRRIT